MIKALRMQINSFILLCGTCAFFVSSASIGAPLVKLNLCNEHDQKIFVAVAYPPGENLPLMSRGWWGVESKSCNQLELPVVGDNLLVYANSEGLTADWSGDVSLCVDSLNKFDFSGAINMDCSGENLKKVKFKGHSIKQLVEASSDGIPKIIFKREDSRSLGDVLRLCNDSSELAYVSYGQKESGPGPISLAGWFKIPPNKCYETLKSSRANELYLFGNNEIGNRRWKGYVPLCVNVYDKFNFVDPLNMNCQDNNQRKHLFKKISMPTDGGFEYHLTGIGSETVRSMVEFCNTANEDIVVAMSFSNPDFIGQHVSSGWFSVKKGQCAKPLPVESEELYILVENDDGTVLRAGTFMACVDTKVAFEFGEATTMACEGPTLEKRSFDTIKIDSGAVKIQLP